jgi:hypothetical protein
MGVGKWLHFTPYEIYLDLRTAPVGALGVTGALYETSLALTPAIVSSFGLGYTAGTIAADLIQTYSPALWDAIGGTVAEMVNNIHAAASLAAQGQLQEAAGELFGLTPSVTGAMAGYGGDYGVAGAWAAMEGGDTWCGDKPCQYNGE